MKGNRIFIAFLLVVSFVACNPNEVFFSYRQTPTSGWHKDSLLTFDYHIQDTLSCYDVFLHVRHFGNYPYQNFWMFLENTDAKGNTTQDTIECYLADEFGKWLGTGNAVKEMPVFYRQNIQLPDSGTYQIKVRHGMRDSVLIGIKEIGLRVELIK